MRRKEGRSGWCGRGALGNEDPAGCIIPSGSPARHHGTRASIPVSENTHPCYYLYPPPPPTTTLLFSCCNIMHYPSSSPPPLFWLYPYQHILPFGYHLYIPTTTKQYFFTTTTCINLFLFLPIFFPDPLANTIYSLLT